MLYLRTFRPRVLQNLRLTHEHMREVNPYIGLVSFSGFGTGGAYDNFRANGGTTEGNAGWDLLFGYQDEPPLMLGTMQADPIVGAQMAAAALAAALRAQEQQTAVHIEGSMFESAVAYIDEYLMASSLGQEMPARNGNRRSDAAPHECVRCADGVDGSDEWIAIAVLDDETWLRLATSGGSGSSPVANIGGSQGTRSGVGSDAERVDSRLECADVAVLPAIDWRACGSGAFNVESSP